MPKNLEAVDRSSSKKGANTKIDRSQSSDADSWNTDPAWRTKASRRSGWRARSRTGCSPHLVGVTGRPGGAPDLETRTWVLGAKDPPGLGLHRPSISGAVSGLLLGQNAV